MGQLPTKTKLSSGQREGANERQARAQRDWPEIERKGEFGKGQRKLTSIYTDNTVKNNRPQSHAQRKGRCGLKEHLQNESQERANGTTRHSNNDIVNCACLPAAISFIDNYRHGKSDEALQPEGAVPTHLTSPLIDLFWARRFVAPRVAR